MSSKLSTRCSDALAKAICLRPRTIVALGLVVAAAALWLTASRLAFQPDRNDLISADLEWNKRCIDWWESFPAMSDVVVVADTVDSEGRDNRDSAERFLSDLAGRLRDSSVVLDIQWGAAAQEFSPKAARLAPLDQFERRLIEASRANPLIESASVDEALSNLTRGIAASATAGASADHQALAAELGSLNALIDSISLSLAPSPPTSNPFLELGLPTDEWVFLESPSGRFLFIRITPSVEADSLNGASNAIEAIRSEIEQVRQDHPTVQAGLTGIDALEADETRIATIDSARSSALAFVLIALILITAFHGWRKPLLALTALLIGIAWSFGFLTLAVGHLQVLSAVFVVILLGLGVDFGLHLAATVEQFRHEHPDGRESFEQVLAEAFRLTGPGVLTGAITTAAAFAVTTLTDFKGVAELGIIASGGVILCLIAMFTVFPALLVIFHHSHRHIRPLRDRSVHLFDERWLNPFAARPRLTISIVGIIVIAAGLASTRLTFSEDLLALQPRHVESVEWQQRIAEDDQSSIWYAVSLTRSLEEARRRSDLFLQMESVAGVGGIGTLFPSQEAEKLALIASHRSQTPAAPPPTPTNSRALRAQLAAMSGLLTDRAANADGPLAGTISELSASIASAIEALDRTRDTSRLDEQFIAFRDHLASTMSALLDPAPVTLGDLPPGLLEPFIDRSDPAAPRYALQVYPKLPDDGSIISPLSPEFLAGFMADMTSVDPDVTGVVAQIYYSNQLIRDSFVRAGLLAFVVVFLIVLFVFRRLADALLSMLPVAVGFVLTFGAMVLLGMDVNPANIIVMPLLFGIGVDSGVHIIHRYRLNPDERPLGFTHGTGKGVTITSLTTIAGFAAMMIADHRGIAGLGFLLALGIALTLLTCWTLLPAVLEVRRRSEHLRPPSPSRSRIKRG